MPKSRFLLILAALVLGGATQPAPAPPLPNADPYVGHWIDEEFEIGSMLEINADGRFAWIFSYGALDLLGQGRWTRQADGSISLTSDPPVNGPRFELVSRTRDENQRGILVRVADENNQTPDYLVPMAETTDGFENGQFMGGEYLFEPRPGRTITAVRVVSGVLALESEAVPAAPGDVITFRFHANDIGAWNFQGETVRREGERLILTWRDQPLDYVRVESVNLGPSEEEAAAEAIAEAEAAIEEPPPVPSATAGPPVGDWVSEIEPGGTLAIRADGSFAWRYRAEAIDLRASGRWAASEQEMYALTSDPPAAAPDFEIVSRERDPSLNGVRVRVVDLTPEQGAQLTAFAQFDDGMPATLPLLTSGERAFPAEAGRRITSVGFMMPSMALESGAFQAENGEAITFRYRPNDFGVWNFQGAQVYRNDPDRLTLLWLWPLNYVRAGTEMTMAVPDPSAAETAAAAEAAEAAVEAAIAANGDRPLPLPDPSTFPIEPPLTPARRDGPPSGPFRPGEQVNTRFDTWSEHQGRFEAVRYSYNVDPQGFGASGLIDGPDGEGGIDADDPDEWHIGVGREIEGDAGAWSVGHPKSGLGLRIGPDGHVAQVCLDSGRQDRAHRLVVGARPPVRLNECTVEGAAAVEAGLLAGESFAIEAYHWAQGAPEQLRGDPRLFPQVLELVRFLQNYRR